MIEGGLLRGILLFMHRTKHPAALRRGAWSLAPVIEGLRLRGLFMVRAISSDFARIHWVWSPEKNFPWPRTKHLAILHISVVP